MAFITKEQARSLLPEVGDVRMEYPTIDETNSMGHVLGRRKPQRCVVVDVRPEHLWYAVKFENGIRESYKVPKYRPENGGPPR